MERQKKIELLKGLTDGSRPAKEVIEILKGEIIEVDSFMEALKITSHPEGFKGKRLVVTGGLKVMLKELKENR